MIQYEIFAKKSLRYLMLSHLLLLSRTKGAKKLTFSIDFHQKWRFYIWKSDEIREIKLRRRRKNLHFLLQNLWKIKKFSFFKKFSKNFVVCTPHFRKNYFIVFCPKLILLILGSPLVQKFADHESCIIFSIWGICTKIWQHLPRTQSRFYAFSCSI